MKIIAILFQLALILLLASVTQAQVSTETSEPTKTTVNKTAVQHTHFVVYYMGDPSSELDDPNSYLRTFMDVYELKVTNTFEVTKDSKGFTLQPQNFLDTPNVVAKELSLIEGVIMIEIAYTKPTTQS